MVMLVLKRSPPEDGKCLHGKEILDFVTRTEAKDRSRLSGDDLFVMTKDKRLAPMSILYISTRA